MFWELHHTQTVPTEDIYAALVPGGCTVEFLHADVKYLGPKEALAHEDEQTAGLSRDKENSEGLGEDTPRRPGVLIRKAASKQLAEESHAFVPTDIDD